MSNKKVSMLWRAGADRRRGCAPARREGLVLFMRRWGCVAAILLLLSPRQASCADRYWNVASGDWSVAANWSGAEPTSSDTAYVVNGGTARITLAGELCKTLSLGNSTGSGNIQMTAGGLSAGSQYVGYSGTGSFTQSGGTNTVSSVLSVGLYQGASGTYSLIGEGQLSVSQSEQVGNYGTGVFNQSAGTNAITGPLYLGEEPGANGTYNLSGGRLSASDENFGHYGGSGVFNHSAGTNAISNALYLGYDSGASATYNLSGTGQLSAQTEYIAYAAYTTAVLQQTGGTNTAGYISIAPAGQYRLSSGTLQINGPGLDNQGTLDFGGGPAVMNVPANALVNLARPGSALKNTQAATLNVGVNSLLIVPAGFDPKTRFAHYSNYGYLHTAGTTLTVPSGQTISGWGSIDDPVDCQGSIAASAGGSLNLNSGLVVSGTGSVNLGGGNVRIENTISGMSSGTLSGIAYHFVGYTGTGAFTQSGGTSAVSEVRLGQSSSSNGTYTLTGSGQLSARWETIGLGGHGTFNQSGGTNIVSDSLALADTGGGSEGTYNLIAGSLSAATEYIAFEGSGTFTQSGGINSISGALLVGSRGSSGARGTYTLNGPGQLSASAESIGSDGLAVFNQSAGTNTISNNLELANGMLGNATYNLSGSGQLSAYNEKLGSYSISSAIFNQSGGTNTLFGTLYVGGNGTINSGKGTYNLTGGVLILRGITWCGGPFNFGGGTLQASGSFSTTQPMTLTRIGGDANIDTAGYAITLSGQLSGPGSLGKMGAGTLTLAAANTYTGDTMVDGGILSITQNMGGGLADLADVKIASGAFLNLGFNGTDAIRSLYLDGGGQVLTGTWGSIGSGAQHQNSHFTGTGLLNVTVAVPEPSTLVLLGIGALGLLAWAWRRRRKCV